MLCDVPHNNNNDSNKSSEVKEMREFLDDRWMDHKVYRLRRPLTYVLYTALPYAKGFSRINHTTDHCDRSGFIGLKGRRFSS